jgi:hypothetical protein
MLLSFWFRLYGAIASNTEDGTVHPEYSYPEELERRGPREENRMERRPAISHKENIP